MIWLVVLALGIWVFVERQRLAPLLERLAHVEHEITRLRSMLAGSEAPRIAPEPIAASAAEPASPTAIAEPAPADLPLTTAAPVSPPTPAVIPKPAVRPSSPPRAEQPGVAVADWLSENGLAWIGGGALALGGLLLVAYAAQRGVFTPSLRIAVAVVLGLTGLAVGERIRRDRGAERSPHLLAAALVTGASAATLYAAIWAAYQLYHFIPALAAAPLLATVSVGLLALALLHGEPLGVLAVAAAFAVPLVTGRRWDDASLDAYVLLILATGLGAAALRRWVVVAAFALAGAGLWGLAREPAHDAVGGTLIASAAPLLALAALIFARRAEEDAADRWRKAQLPLFAAAAAGASLLALFQWDQTAPSAAPCAAISTALVAAVVAAAVRKRLASPMLQLGPVLVAALAALLAWSPGFAGHALWVLPVLAVIAAAGVDGALVSDQRRLSAVIGGAGTALALTLAAPALSRELPGWAWTVDLAFAAALAAGAVILVRRSDDPTTDWTPAALFAPAAEATGLALHAGLDGRVLPTAYGLLGVALAVLSVRIRWRGFAESAVVAGLASFAALLGGPVAGDAIAGKAPLAEIAVICGAAVLAQSAAWWVLRRREDVAASTDAVSTSAVLSALLGAFLVLQTLGAPHGGAGPRLDAFTQASFRTVLILVAGLTLGIRGSASSFGRIRAPIFLAIGALHGLLLEGYYLHPWWGNPWFSNGLPPPPVIGPPLFDMLFVGLLAPALLLAYSARTMARQHRGLAAAAIAAAALFLLLWMLSEVRRLFHGPMLTQGPLGYAEAAAYGGALLVLALALGAAGQRIAGLVGSAAAVRATLEAVSYGSLAVSWLLLVWTASPWWGPLDGDLRSPWLFGAIYAAGCALTGVVAALARRATRPVVAQVALAAAGIELFALTTLGVRFGFHGGAMRVPLSEASLETWTFSAVWAVYGLILLAVGASRRDMALRGLGLAVLLVTTAKVFLFDLARLEGVFRAASFLALGVVLLIGALAARRFAARPVKTPAPE